MGTQNVSALMDILRMRLDVTTSMNVSTCPVARMRNVKTVPVASSACAPPDSKFPIGEIWNLPETDQETRVPPTLIWDREPPFKDRSRYTYITPLTSNR